MQKTRKKAKSQKISRKIRRDDKVVVVAGNCKGQTGSVLRFMGDDRVLVQGVNLRKKHVRPTQENPQGNIIDIERPVHISNVQVCDDEGRPVRLKVKVDENGEKHLYYKKGGEEVIHRSLKKVK